MTTLWWGLSSWLLAALALGLVAALLPPWRGARLAALAASLAGGLAGGLLASALAFGGLAAFDPRSLTTAALAALVALLLLGLGRTRRAATRTPPP